MQVLEVKVAAFVTVQRRCRRSALQIMEIELECENEGAALPDYVQVIRDVSADIAYKNRSLAENVIYEEI